MNKLLTKIVGLSLGLSMAIGVGVAASYSEKDAVRADASTTYYMTPNQATSGSSSTSYVTTDTSFTSGGVSWTLRQWNPKSLQIKANQSSAASEFCFYTGQFGGTITEVVISFKSIGTMKNAAKMKMVGSSTAFSAQQNSGGSSMTWDSSALTLTWTANSSSGYRAIAFYQDGKAASGNNYLAESNSISVTYETGGTSYYSVTYDANGATSGTAPTDSTSYASGSTVTVASNSGNLAKTGYTFGGWNSSADGTGTNYVAGTGTFTISDNTKLYAKWNADTLSSITITGSMSKTTYKVNDSWDPTGFTVTANYQSGAHVDVTNDSGLTWSYSPATATSTSVTSVTATASFGGESATSSAQSVSVSEGVTYDLTKISGFSSWTNSYTTHSVSSADVGASVAANMNFSITNKQSSGVGSEYPCIGGKTNSELECLVFTLTETGKKITSVDIVFVTRYTSTFPSLYLHKGSGISTTAIESLTMSGVAGDEHSLSVSYLNDTVFTIGYNAHQTSSNGAVGIKSISIGLENQSSFGTLDHISVTALPNVVYHVGETYDSTGLVVTAYDGADESTANFKDVTSSVETDLDDPTPFVDSDVPGFDCDVSYSGDGGSDTTSFHVYVYALAEYDLVTEEPSDWSGQYLIVGTNYNSDLVAMNGGLANPDTPNGYKVVSESSSSIQTGQELEWTIAKVTGGYSIQGKSGKYIGSLTTKGNGMLVSETALVNTISYSTEDNATVITGTNDYNLKIFNESSSSRFRYYSSGTVQLYRKAESSAGDQYAQLFLGAFTCDNGAHEPSFTIKEGSTYWTWALLKTEYNKLDNADKEDFRLGTPSESGTNIQQAIARYDAVIRHWGEAKYENFMNRTITPVGGLKVAFGLFEDPNTSITIIVAISAISLTSVGAFFALRKRKENI